MACVTFFVKVTQAVWVEKKLIVQKYGKEVAVIYRAARYLFDISLEETDY